MPARRIAILVLTALVATACSPLGSVHEASPAPRSTAPSPSRVLSEVPVSFIENRGQVSNDVVSYYMQTPAAGIGFTSTGLRVALSDTRGTNQRWNLAMDFVGGRAMPVADDLQEGIVSYFKGDPEDWRTAIPTYGRIAYRDLWPGVDLVYRADGPKLKYEFVVHPDGDPGDIRLRWRGASLALKGGGSLRISTPAGSISDAAPVSFQGDRRIQTTYELDGTIVGFRLNEYDQTQPLVIDPVVTVYSGYIGGLGADEGQEVVVDASGAAYLTGYTLSTEASFPVSVGPDLTANGMSDAFVVKLAASGMSVAYAGYIGGSQTDRGWGIAVDGVGSAYVSGYTESTETTFPVLGGPDLTANGMGDAFVAKVAPSGTSLSYSGFIGGDGADISQGVAVDAAGAAYVSGNTGSTQATFPVTIGPDLLANGNLDAFVAKVIPSGAGLSFAGFIGGAGDDRAESIAIDGAGAAHVVGSTISSQPSFPVIVGPDLIANGSGDAFVAKVAPSGASLIYSGFIGGSGFDSGEGIALDPSGNAYVSGSTSSTEATFPVAVGPDLTANGIGDAFVAKVDSSGGSLSFAGFIGGSGTDYGTDVAVDRAGAAYVVGYTDSTQATFPVLDGPDLTTNGGLDIYVAKVATSGASLSYAGFIGGGSGDEAYSIAVDDAGAAYITGSTVSTEATFPVTVGPDLVYNGGTDAYIVKVSDNLCLGAAVTIQGTSGDDTIVGTVLDDVIAGLGGKDTIDGSGGNDTICAGDGDDTVIGGSGDDKLDGEAGTDTASFPGTAGVTANITTGTATGQSTDTLANIENLIGSSANDVLIGNTSANVLRGGSGKDSLNGGSGNDRLFGENGKDTASGGDGDDRAEGGLGADRLKGDKGKDTLLGQSGNDRLTGGRGKDSLNGGSGNDVLNGGKKNDRCSGGKGTGDTATKCEIVKGVP